MTDAQFLSELSTSTLRVSDPILSDLYYGIKGENNPARPAEPAEPKEAPAAETAAQEPARSEPAPVPESVPEPVREEQPKNQTDSTAADPLIENAVKTAKNLKLEADRTENFNMLRPTGFFQRLNDFCMNRNAFDNKEVRANTDPLLTTLIDRIDLWSQNIRPEKYFVTQEAVDSIDWLLGVSPIVFTCPIRYENREMNLGSIVKARLSEIFQSISIIPSRRNRLPVNRRRSRRRSTRSRSCASVWIWRT